MSQPWEFIADSLRAELADYGGLLHLFEAQQRSLFSRDPEAVLRYAGEIEAQARAVADSRNRREQAVAGFASAHGQPGSASLRSLLPLIAAEARPLFEALIAEVNLLLHRVRRTSRHNHTPSSRAPSNCTRTPCRRCGRRRLSKPIRRRAASRSPRRR